MRLFKSTYKTRAGIRETKNWYIEFYYQQVRHRLPAFTDKGQSEALARQIEHLVQSKGSGIQLDAQSMRWLENIPDKLRLFLVRIGLVSEHRAAAGKSLQQHLQDFRQSLQDKGNTDQHCKLVVSRIERVITGCKFINWSDISASRVQRCIADLRNNGEGIGSQTSNFYLQAIKQFCRWMVQDRRASESPVEYLKGLNVRTDRRHDRRALESDDVRRLLETTRNGRKRFCMTGLQRTMLYRVAVETGLRAGELRSLKVSSFDLDGGTVTVEAAYSKHRRQDTLPLRPDTVQEIKAFVSGKMPHTEAFNLPCKDNMVKMLRADLADAGIPYVDDSGRYADFHSLRHTTGSLLAASGTHPKVAQSIMRHSDINLTLGRYSHVYKGQESEAVAALPDLSQPSIEKQRAAKTGTDDAGKILAESRRIITAKMDYNGQLERDKKIQKKAVTTVNTAISETYNNTPGGIRTHDLRFRKPSLYPS
jgi:integrase